MCYYLYEQINKSKCIKMTHFKYFLLFMTVDLSEAHIIKLILFALIHVSIPLHPHSYTHTHTVKVRILKKNRH